jgi:hypothetical protein
MSSSSVSNDVDVQLIFFEAVSQYEDSTYSTTQQFNWESGRIINQNQIKIPTFIFWNLMHFLCNVSSGLYAGGTYAHDSPQNKTLMLIINTLRQNPTKVTVFNVVCNYTNKYVQTTIVYTPKNAKYLFQVFAPVTNEVFHMISSSMCRIMRFIKQQLNLSGHLPLICSDSQKQLLYKINFPTTVNIISNDLMNLYFVAALITFPTIKLPENLFDDYESLKKRSSSLYRKVYGRMFNILQSYGSNEACGNDRDRRIIDQQFTLQYVVPTVFMSPIYITSRCLINTQTKNSKVRQIQRELMKDLKKMFQSSTGLMERFFTESNDLLPPEYMQ